MRQGYFIVRTENLKKGMLYLEVGRVHPPEYPYPLFGITMKKIFQQRRAKQQCDNLINRPRRNPYYAIEDNPVGWVLGRPPGPSHGGLGNSEGPQAAGFDSLRLYLDPG
ncbi:hypothetical protein [Leptothoe spongobia]|uniref:Uncharacterized protein n=1 Tax=Leptothoe spongobia TAU-MAC 1115 TaxID=1967444 RepID=A0A947DJY3_9CYAN|nr:hypothetical protein [Leptothoe spongobia]MBT9317256.1 hypothetical protein [Leptothoe spongobia TAU-MAC 1115]